MSAAREREGELLSRRRDNKTEKREKKEKREAKRREDRSKNQRGRGI